MIFWILIISLIGGFLLYLYGCEAEADAIEIFSEHKTVYSNYRWRVYQIVGLVVAFGPAMILIILDK